MNRLRTALALTAALLLAACDTGPQVVEPTPEPEPVTLVLYAAPPQSPAAIADADIEALESALLTRTGLHVDVQVIARDADALAAVCDAALTPPAAAWLGGLTFAASQAGRCGLPVLQVVRENPDAAPTAAPVSQPTPAPVDQEADADAEAEAANADADAQADEPPAPQAREAAPPATITGRSVRIIAARTFGSVDPTAVRGRVYCRTTFTDFASWLVPTLAFGTFGVDLERDAARIDEYPDHAALVDAVAEGDCDLAGVPAGLVTVGDANYNIAYTVPAEFPLSVLVLPVTIGGGERLILTNALLDIAADADDAALLAPLLGQTALEPVTAEDFAPLLDFVGRSRVDLAALGR
jgi:ABC-type phosphate/phosphonate transport system substrate-binding protein